MDTRPLGKSPELMKLVNATPHQGIMNRADHRPYDPVSLVSGWHLLRPLLADKVWKTKPGNIILLHQPSGDRFLIELLK